MNFGDWQLFRATVSQMATSCEAAGYVGSHHSKPPPPPYPQVLNMRHIENQLLQEEAASEQGSIVGSHADAGRRGGAPPHASATNADGSPMYNFNLSFEELSNVGLDESTRQGGVPWMVNTRLAFVAAVIDHHHDTMWCIRVFLRAPLIARRA